MIYLNFVDELVVDIFSILFLYREDFLDVLFISIFFYFLYKITALILVMFLSTPLNKNQFNGPKVKIRHGSEI